MMRFALVDLAAQFMRLVNANDHVGIHEKR